MKKIKYLVIALVAIGFASCSSNGPLKPVSTKISGPLGKYFEVVDREYMINDKALNIEFKRIAEGGPESASWDSHPTFTVELIDKNGNTIESYSTDVVWTKDQLENVFALSTDETATITFKFDKTKGAEQIKVSSKWDEDAERESSTSSSDGGYTDSDDDVAESSSSSTDWDELLDDYEEYTDAYIRLYKKAMNGDMNALTEYAEMLEKAESVYDKMDGAGDMTTAQINRMNKIHQKLLKAM